MEIKDMNNEMWINNLGIDNSEDEQKTICNNMIKRNWIIFGLLFILVGFIPLIVEIMNNYFIITKTYWFNKVVNRNKYLWYIWSIVSILLYFAPPIIYIVFAKKVIKKN